MTPPAASTDQRRSQPRGGGQARDRSLYRPLSGLVVRAPLLPAADYQRLGSGAGAAARAWADPAVRFAVTVASPDLAAALSPPGGTARSSPRALAALQRYLIRACLRPTPFGGFAAAAIGHWADRTSLRIAPGPWPTGIRPDMGWLAAITQRLAQDPDCRPGLRFFANTCAFERDGRIYLSGLGPGGRQDAADLSVRATSIVRRVLMQARAGARLEELKQDILTFWTHAAPGQADRLLVELCEHRLLLPALHPSLTSDPLGHVIGQLDTVPAAARTTARLSVIGSECARVAAAGPAATALTALRGQMRELADSLGAGQAAGRGDTLQVDSALPLLAEGVSRQIAEEVTGAVDVLFRLHSAPHSERLAGYRAAFHRRYGDDRRVPLPELLDPRFGLGPPGHGMEHLPAPGARQARARAELLQRLVAASIRDSCGELVLTPDLIAQLATWSPDRGRIAPSLELSIFVAARSAAAVDGGDFQLVIGPNLGATAAGRGLGRFADLLGAPAHALLQEAADAESAGPGLMAELVCWPARARSANVAIRPLVRPYEVPVGTAPSLPPDAVVHVDELSVMLRDGRLRLCWGRAGCELSLTTGHMLNSAAYPPLGQHLIELASDGLTSLAPFDWGPLSTMPFLPRVRTGRVVLCPAQWRLDLTATNDASAGPARFGDWLADWRSRWQMPRHVYLTSADNRLLLDLDEKSHREQLRATLNRPGQRSAVLQEGLPGPEDAWLPGPRGLHMVELVVPLVREPGKPGRAGPGASHGPDPAGPEHGTRRAVPPHWDGQDRLRPPGSDWLYVILGGPRANEDALLAGSLGALAERFVEQGDADGWFFVRYSDPEPQLRLRLHGDGKILTGRVLPALAEWGALSIADGSRTRLALQTYERELERYGGPATTAICERIACVDSRAVRSLLLHSNGRGVSAAPLDWMELAVLSTSDLLSSLIDDSAEQARLCKKMAGPAARSGASFRQRQARLRALMTALESGAPVPDADGGQLPGGYWQRVQDTLASRRAALTPLVTQLQDRYRAGTGLQPVDQLAPSLVHLHANRLGLNEANEQLMLGWLDSTLRSLRAYP
jgi:thiopeptide-type bacteriocin biosynthesis protein